MYANNHPVVLLMGKGKRCRPTSEVQGCGPLKCLSQRFLYIRDTRGRNAYGTILMWMIYEGFLWNVSDGLG